MSYVLDTCAALAWSAARRTVDHRWHGAPPRGTASGAAVHRRHDAGL